MRHRLRRHGSWAAACLACQLCSGWLRRRPQRRTAPRFETLLPSDDVSNRRCPVALPDGLPSRFANRFASQLANQPDTPSHSLRRLCACRSAMPRGRTTAAWARARRRCGRIRLAARLAFLMGSSCWL